MPLPRLLRNRIVHSAACHIYHNQVVASTVTRNSSNEGGIIADDKRYWCVASELITTTIKHSPSIIAPAKKSHPRKPSFKPPTSETCSSDSWDIVDQFPIDVRIITLPSSCRPYHRWCGTRCQLSGMLDELDEYVVACPDGLYRM